MIVTITMNPSIDISYPLAKFELDTVNRTASSKKTAGGKGLNVTRVLTQVGAEVLASGLIGGFLGEEIKFQLDKDGIQHAFSKIAGETRNCIAILHQGNQTEILETGPVVTEKEANNFLKDFEKLAEVADIFVFSGSLPTGLPKNFYARMISISARKGKSVILDCSGETLRRALESEDKPLLIKPNTEELSQLLDREIPKSVESLKAALSNPLFEGVEWVVVSMGAEGSFAKHNNTFYRVQIPKIDVVNPVGSGDSTVAGLTEALAAGDADEIVLKKGNVLGMLNAQEPLTGYVNMNNYQKIFNQLVVRKV